MTDRSTSSLMEEWNAIQKAAPPKPDGRLGRPPEEQLVLLRAHKAREKAFLAQLSDDQRVMFTKKRSHKKKNEAQKQRSNKKKTPEVWPKLAPLEEPVSLGWDHHKHKFDRVLTFYHQKKRTQAEVEEDAHVYGGIDRRVFCNLFVDTEKLRVPAVLDADGNNLMQYDFLNEMDGLCSESFFQAAKCLHECDARFIMNELDAHGAAMFGQSKLPLTREQKDRLIELGASPDDFLEVTSSTGDSQTVSWRRGKDGKLPRRPDWGKVKHNVMMHVLRAKFVNGKPGTVARKTVATLLEQPSVPLLVEHTSNDRLWADGRSGDGWNLLGKTITQLLLETSGAVPVATLGEAKASLSVPNKEIVSYSWPVLKKPPPRPKDQPRKKPNVDYICVLDFEATCNDGPLPPPQEIIEFPTLLVNTRTGAVDSEFHLYIKPDVHPELSAFCTNLTGITQQMVDAGVTLDDALKRHQKWLADLNILPFGSAVSSGMETFLYVTCGDWDLKTCLPKQLQYHGKTVPGVFSQWINIKSAFHSFYGVKPMGMTHMLRISDLQLERADTIRGLTIAETLLGFVNVCSRKDGIQNVPVPRKSC